MSWWTTVRNAVELSTVGAFGLASDSAYNQAGALANRVLGRSSAAEKREQAQMAQDQIQAYKDQTALTEKQIADAQAEKAVQKRKINEKQIRALRNNYRPAGGFLGNQSSAGLGNQGDLTNTLGT